MEEDTKRLNEVMVVVANRLSRKKFVVLIKQVGGSYKSKLMALSIIVEEMRSDRSLSIEVVDHWCHVHCRQFGMISC